MGGNCLEAAPEHLNSLANNPRKKPASKMKLPERCLETVPSGGPETA
jgi:hypothetical protein